jgi:hypothetical protein
MFGGGILNLFGDSAANKILVTAISKHTFAVTSIDGTTTINGSTAPFVVGDVRGLNVHLNGGNDFMHITRTDGDVTIFADMGGGNDGLAMTFARHDGMTSLNTGPGDDVVSVGSSEFEALVLINVGSGNSQACSRGWTSTIPHSGALGG